MNEKNNTPASSLTPVLMIFTSDLAYVIFFKGIVNKYSVICKDTCLLGAFFLPACQGICSLTLVLVII